MAVDPAFKGVGKKEGLEIFRIEVSTAILAINGACVVHEPIPCDSTSLSTFVSYSF